MRMHRLPVLQPRVLQATAIPVLLWATGVSAWGGALEDYVRKPDARFAWKQVKQKVQGDFTVVHLRLTSQEWRGQVWQHDVQVVRPASVRTPDAAFLYVTGDGDGTGALALLKLVAQRAGAVAAVVASVPNQPLYDGRKEDALIAYSFDQYLKSGDASWPLLLPMVKSAVRAMDAVAELAAREHGGKVERFVVAGMSKRGWTTWLTGAVDARVAGIAPMVFDMLNMKAQVQWSRKVYGRQSEKIHDYTELGLIERMDEPAMDQLRTWVDPFSYRQRHVMPKLILLGTNDPYWTVDALRHYWSDLPEPKLVFQTPNAGHDLAGGLQAFQTLAAFVQMIGDRRSLPKLTWQFRRSLAAEVSVQTDRPAKTFRLWGAHSKDRDFRDERWFAREMTATDNGTVGHANLNAPPDGGYHAFMVEATFAAGGGQDYQLSTEVCVLPDDVK